MNRMFLSKLVVVIGLTVAILPVATAQAQEPQVPPQPQELDITGVYICDGVNPEGNPYRGVVEIVRTQDTFHLRWTFPQTDDVALGIGIVSNGVLAVSYYGGAMVGVVVYKVGDGKKMVGEWTLAGVAGKVYSETLTKVSDGGVTEPVHPPVPQPHQPQPPKLKDA